MRFIVSFLTCVAIAAIGCGGSDESSATTAQQSVAGVRLRQIGSFDSPVYLTAPPGDKRRLFVVEQEGTIREVRDGKKVAKPFLDIRSQVEAGGERGLLSMAFAPDYSKS